MARNYGRFTTSIWRDPDFTSLTPGQQAAYFMLCTQPEVTAAGTLALTLRRWAKHAAGLTPDTLRDELGSLEDARHILIDEDTEELLITKFVKWDGGWSNSKRLPVVLEAVRAIASVHIRDTAVDELRRIAASDAASDDGKRARDALSDALSTFDRVVVTSGDQVPHPLTTTQGGEPLDEDVEPPSEFCPKHPNGTTDSCGACGTAKRINRGWHERAAQCAERRRAELRAAIRDCTLCDQNGFTDAGDNRVTRCDHTSPLALVAGVGRVQDKAATG